MYLYFHPSDRNLKETDIPPVLRDTDMDVEFTSRIGLAGVFQRSWSNGTMTNPQVENFWKNTDERGLSINKQTNWG
jgi:hypothetical protein